jgi:hypothetical protein
VDVWTKLRERLGQVHWAKVWVGTAVSLVLLACVQVPLCGSVVRQAAGGRAGVLALVGWTVAMVLLALGVSLGWEMFGFRRMGGGAGASEQGRGDGSS